MELIDTHCHIQEAIAGTGGDPFVQKKWAAAGFTKPDVVISEAVETGVTCLICVGCTLEDSQLAVVLAQQDEHCYASIGIHPHEAKSHINDSDKLQKFRNLLEEKRVVAIGECGLDYYYNHSSKVDQIKALHFQLELAQKHHLPVIFHVREAFDDFWPIFDQYKGLRGVIHSFSANQTVLEQTLSRELYVGLNGIMTFTKDEAQLAAARAVPIEKMLVETDAPFLTPHPCRGTICQPKHVRLTAEFLAKLRHEDLAEFARHTTANARQLFNF